MTKEEIEEKKLELERERLELEKAHLQKDRRFFEKHLGAIITATISLAAVLVSGAQVWVASISADKELEITYLQKKNELDLARLEQDRRWQFDIADFVFRNKDLIFSGDEETRTRLRNVMVVTFPPETSDKLFEKLEATVSETEKNVWREGQKIIQEKLPKGYSFAVVGSYKEFNEAIQLAKKLQLSQKGYTPEIYLSENNYYAVSLGGYLSYKEALNRVEYAKKEGIIAQDAYIRSSRNWGENLLK